MTLFVSALGGIPSKNQEESFTWRKVSSGTVAHWLRKPPKERLGGGPMHLFLIGLGKSREENWQIRRTHATRAGKEIR